ncbi:hypothetical protein NQ317_008773 [Molorchus minor]|uniref:Uncharacterized protein n=1 Tax=Molorchus minor TaxID=1323400 RepID=A0ABQ9IVW6_9CUCU|nr:hypothetical protein NQ317_008773 [Molorchus minor]
MIYQISNKMGMSKFLLVNKTDNFEEDMAPEEFEKLDSQLDALNSALDDIEQKNDDIHAQLVQLLHANREIRQQLQASKVADSEPQL